MSDPLPSRIRERLEAFCAEGKTGQVTLNIHRGTIGSVEIKEHLRAQEEKRLTNPEETS